ncbi:MAG: helix-hairpin-helix domain-containing protein, partial [Candidatus Poribacteria bacterium]|nr:helix-hairpin-helix domain-containing protein [Candidatus Poribacteria bacterium]
DLLAQRAETVKEAKVALAAALTLNSTNLGNHPFISVIMDKSLNAVMEESELLIEDSDVTILGDNILDYLGGSTVPVVDINTATTEELAMLPWVGTNMASRIINARPYTRIEDLLEVAGIGPSRFNDIKNLVTVKQQDSK